MLEPPNVLSTALFVDADSIKKYECPICTNVLQDPRSCHCFCNGCLKESMKNKQECPSCRDALTPESICTNLLVKECIGNERVHCFTRLPALEDGHIEMDESKKDQAGIADSSGNKRKSSSSSSNNSGSSSSSSSSIAPKRAKSDFCTWIGKLTDAKQHFKECRYAGTLCGFGCGAIVIRKNMTEHTTITCPKRAVPCSNVGCKALMPEPMLAAHKANSCPFEKVDCPFKSAGCREHVLRKDAKNHADTAINQHMLLLLQSNQSLQGDNHLLRQDIQALQRDNFLLQQQVADQDNKQQHEIVFKVKVGDFLRAGEVSKESSPSLVGAYNAEVTVQKGYDTNGDSCGVYLYLNDGPFPCRVSCCIDIVHWGGKAESDFMFEYTKVFNSASSRGNQKLIPIRELTVIPSPYVNELDDCVTFIATFRILPLE